MGSCRAFAAILSSPGDMTGCSSLCIEARYRPLHGAHVTLDRFIICWPLPPVMGSPHRRVLSASLTAQGCSGLPHCLSLSDPSSRACTRGLSLVHIPALERMPWVRTPDAAPQPRLSGYGDATFPAGGSGSAPAHPINVGALYPIPWCSGLRSPCRRFAGHVTVPNARLGT